MITVWLSPLIFYPDNSMALEDHSIGLETLVYHSSGQKIASKTGWLPEICAWLGSYESGWLIRTGYFWWKGEIDESDLRGIAVHFLTLGRFSTIHLLGQSLTLTSSCGWGIMNIRYNPRLVRRGVGIYTLEIVTPVKYKNHSRWKIGGAFYGIPVPGESWSWNLWGLKVVYLPL